MTGVSESKSPPYIRAGFCDLGRCATCSSRLAACPFNNEDFPRFPFDSKPAQGESWNNRWGIFVTRATQSGSWTMNTPSRNADSRLLGWIIAVCSVLFVASVLVMSGETTQIASNTTLVTPTER
jgi:hypothetical protein